MTRKLSSLVAASMIAGSALTTGIALVAVGCYVDSVAWTWAGSICLWLFCAGAVWGMFLQFEVGATFNELADEIVMLNDEVDEREAEVRRLAGCDPLPSYRPAAKWGGRLSHLN